MGQAKLKAIKPEHHAGPRGHEYFCRNRCGTVVHRKGTNETFLERPLPLWGWCDACKRMAVQHHAVIVANQVIGECTTQAQALQRVRGVQLIDGRHYDLGPVLLELPAFKALTDDLQEDHPAIRMSGPPPVRTDRSTTA